MRAYQSEWQSGDRKMGKTRRRDGAVLQRVDWDRKVLFRLTFLQYSVVHGLKRVRAKEDLPALTAHLRPHVSKDAKTSLPAMGMLNASLFDWSPTERTASHRPLRPFSANHTIGVPVACKSSHLLPDQAPRDLSLHGAGYQRA